MTADFNVEDRAITVAEFVEHSPAELAVKLVAGKAGFDLRRITSERIQKLGLALAGFGKYIHQGRIQIVGQSETAFLAQLQPATRIESLRSLDLDKIACVLLTKVTKAPAELIEIADESGLPVLQTPLGSSKAISLVTDFLQEQLAPTTILHGVLMEMFGVGVMLFGESGIGKSECALDLITRGYRLVSDDAVQIKRIGKSLEGRAPELTAEYLEIHGLGIINVRDLFGVSSICDRIKVELCIELKRWSEVEDIERIGLEMQEREIFGVRLAKFVLPVSSGRNLSTLVETAVRVYLLRNAGIDATRELIEKHSIMISGAK